ncbi:hypothetical protein QFZ79_003293 [Arthrobacter sp. V4I6]|nr:hypothetical protein [Arthrobacter sp. V4I6]
MAQVPSGVPAHDEPFQLSLLSGFPSSSTAAATSGPALAAELPVARVLIESSLPHLDRPFDYSVPADLDAAARPGVRLKVKFNGQELPGYLLERVAESDAGHALVPVHQVVSPVPVLMPAVAELAGRVAARYAGTTSDVLRVAVPPRMAKLEKEFAPDGHLDPALFADAGADGGAGAAIPAGLEASSWAGYRNGPAFLQHLCAGESPRAVLAALQGYGAGGWPRMIAEAVAAVRLSGRGAVVVVPDYRDLDRVEAALLDLLPAGDVARLTADDGPTPRYRSYLRILSGAAGVAVGTRSAAYAPVHNLGLVVCWDDGDDLHIEQRSPYAHAREVLLLRAGQEGAACLLAGHTRSTETQRLVASGWAWARRGGPHRGAPHRSAGAEHRGQLRAGARPAGPGRPPSRRSLAGCQGGPGTRARPRPGSPRRLRPLAGLRDLPRTRPVHRLQRSAGDCGVHR